MVDNVTGEIIEQKPIKPIFSEKSILEILNDELERYPQVKADNDYAASEVVRRFLSGEMKVDDSTLEAIGKTVDNVAIVNIMESAEEVRNSDRVTPEQDAEYLELAKDPKKNDARLREMVEEAANKNEDIRFSMRRAVEETEDLVAVHNLREEQIVDALKRGQFTMPSVAVTNKGHTDFGEVSIVFKKDTIDPSLNADNRLYGSDAWTPTQTNIKKNPVFDNDAVSKVLKDVKNTIGNGFSQIFDVSRSEFKDTLTKADGSIYDAFSEDMGLQTAYAMKNGIIKRIPKVADGKIDTNQLKSQLDAALGKDAEWRNYKKWLEGISDSVITSYDMATNEDLLNNMKSQPETAKEFRLGENGELTVPAVEYNSIDEYRANKGRLSEDADEMTRAVGQSFVGWANGIAENTNVALGDVVNAINNSFGVRYQASDIVNTFADNGISISRADAKALQHLYKQAVELPTKYFEAKPQRAVGLDEVAKVILPDNASDELKSILAENNIPFVEYGSGNEQARLEALNSVENVRFSLRTTAEQDADYMKAVSHEDVTVSYKGKPFWAALVNQKTGEILATYTLEEMDHYDIVFDELPHDVMERDGYVWFNTDLLQDNDRIEYDDFGTRLPDHLIQRINEQIEVTRSERWPHLEHSKEMDDDFGQELKYQQNVGNVDKGIKTFEEWVERDGADTVSDLIMTGWGTESSPSSPIHRYLDSLEETLPDSEEMREAFTKEIKRYVESEAEGDIRYSDRDSTSVYELMGETESIVKENKKLTDDVGRLKEILESAEVENRRFLSLANYLKKLSGSNMDSAKLGRMLKDAYTSMQTGKTLSWGDIALNTHHIASSLMTGDINVSVDYFKRAMSEIRNEKFTLSAEQLKRVDERFGNYGNFHKYVFGRLGASADGKPLTEMWEKWSKKYPALFDENVSGADQIDALIEAVDVLKTTGLRMEEYERAEAIRHLSTEIYNQFWNIATNTALSDKAKAYKSEHLSLMEDLKKGYEQRQKALVVHPTGETALKYENILRRAKDNSRREVATAREKGRERLAQYRENAERKTRIQSITSNALSLLEMLDKNSKDKHIPEVMKDVVRELLTAINFSSKRMLENGEPTHKDIRLANAFRNLNVEMLQQTAGVSEALEELYGSEIDEKTANLAKAVDKIMETIGENEFILNKMSAEDLKNLDHIIKILKRAINRVNQFHVTQHSAGVRSLGIQSTRELDGRKKLYNDNKKHFDKLKTKLYWNNLTPYYAFKNLGESAQKIFTAFMDGQDKIAFLSKEVIETTRALYTPKDYKKWSETYYDFEVMQPNGQTKKFSMNVPQIMALYCVIKQDDAKKHILYGDENGSGGGITIVETKEKEAVRTNIRLTETDINSIISKLDDRAKGVADELQKYMSTRGAELGNEISMARWGIKTFGIENYFPIKVSDGQAPIKDDAPGVNANSFLAILNKSFTHSRNHFAKQSVEIGDIFDVFANHMSEMIQYNAMALPVLDMFKWMNCHGMDENGNEFSVSTSVKETFGDDAWGYIKTFMQDINGSTKKSTRDNLAIRFFKNAKIAKVANNIRVAALQFTSYVRAGAVMDNKYLLRALAHKPKPSKAKEWCGIALWKSMGYFDTDITRSITDKIKHAESVKDKTVEATLWGVEKADEWAWGYLWNACELEVRETRRDLEVGSKEFNKEVGIRLREIVYRTQVVDSQLTRSQMMRSPDGWDKMLTMFASESTLSFNLVTDVFASQELDKRSMGKKAAKEKNKKYMRKVITAYVVTNVVTSALQSLFDAFRDYDEDDKDEEYWAKLMAENFANNTSFLNKIPYINVFGSIVSGFSASRVETDWMESTVKSAREMFKIISGEGSGEKLFKNLLKALSDATGIAAYNIYRDVVAFLKLFDAD
jgi:hypothetical protein